jgi:hypothetical protein
MIQNGSSYTQMHLEAELDAIIYEIDFGGIISQDIEYFYWDALEDISRPGKFQGQPAWVAFLYQCANHGMQTDELSLNPDVSGEVMIYFDDAPVLCPWPHTPKDAVIYIDEQGFVHADDYEHWLQALDEVEEDIEEEG